MHYTLIRCIIRKSLNLLMNFARNRASRGISGLSLFFQPPPGGRRTPGTNFELPTRHHKEHAKTLESSEPLTALDRFPQIFLNAPYLPHAEDGPELFPPSTRQPSQHACPLLADFLPHFPVKADDFHAHPLCRPYDHHVVEIVA